ncbi:MAG: SDR family NAD(P)-dependent oxidoreductase, partial [Phycicoccus sp.]
MTHYDISGGRTDHPVVLLTGPTSGIGAAVLARLIEHAARPTLLLLARDPGTLGAAVQRARRRGLSAHGVAVDLADLGSVTKASAKVRDLVRRGDVRGLDAVVLNAGTQLTDRRRRSAQGHELTFAVNVLAQHVLARELESSLAGTALVVPMGSSTHRGKRASFGLVPDPVWQPPDVMAAPDLTPPPGRPGSREPGGVAYATSKLALVTLSHEWADRMTASGRRLVVYDPGLVAGTGLGRDMKPYEYWAWRRVMPALSLLPGATTPARTARHLVALALGETHPDLHDGYVEMGRA